MIKRLSINWFRRNKWRFLGSLPRQIDKCILIVGPHVEVNDVKIAIAIHGLTNFKSTIVADRKKSNPITRLLMSSLNIVYVDFNNREKTIENLSTYANKKSNHSLVFTYNHFGDLNANGDDLFYAVAQNCKATLMPIAIDHRRKTVKFHNPFEMSNHRDRDLNYIRNFFANFYTYVEEGFLYGEQKSTSR
ncbi:MAG: hypothetical protein GC193_02255 [Cryomorphaceae bacterium]|nr:hypothetical protein [Cryomorphaceae bacterium]